MQLMERLGRKSLQASSEHPRLSLCCLFLLWKALLVLIVVTCPGVGYDTSTTLMNSSKNIPTKLLRWDAIYFASIAKRGHTFEQEWAFGWAFPRLLGWMSHYMQHTSLRQLRQPEALIGIVIAHVAHLSSILMLLDLSKTMFKLQPKGLKIAFVSACLHIMSPAGIFLSAPYAESLFSLLQFSGYHCFVKGYDYEARRMFHQRDFYMITAGCLLGLGTSIRSNGVLSVLIFLYDLVNQSTVLLQSKNIQVRLLRKLFTLGLCGFLVSAGLVIPQYLAYREYCMDASKTGVRPWCNHFIPSIYIWVQSHYWNVGFLHYWTFSNLPLFLLALPMLVVMVWSSMWAWKEPLYFQQTTDVSESFIDAKTATRPPYIAFHYARPFATVQFVLSVLAFTNFHVQIVTRLSSGYPIWYWWLASGLLRSKSTVQAGKSPNYFVLVARWIVMYATIQAGLFASFLPPA